MTEQPQYTVRGTSHADPDSNPLFYALDEKSRRPYASSRRGKTTTDLVKAVDWLDKCQPSMAAHVRMYNARVVRLDYVPVNIDNVLAEKASAEELVAGMSDIEKTAVRMLLK